MSAEAPAPRHIRLTSHAGGYGALPIRWGAATPGERGPVVGTTTQRSHRNVIGTHSGSYSVYRALAVAAGALSRQHKADLTNTAPTDEIGPYPQWSDPGRIVSLDPWGAVVSRAFAAELAAGYDIRPTIAVTKAHVVLPEVIDALHKGRLKADGRILTEGGAAINQRLQVLDREGHAIEGLFAVGQNGLGGQVLWGHGLHIAWALTSGRLAGQELGRGAPPDL